MLSYTFSRREKMLILILAIILIAVAWYMLVFQSTSNQLHSISNEQAYTDEQTVIASSKVAQMNHMRDVIDQRKSEGATPTPIPDYDNVKALMAHLDTVMSTTDAYELTFEELDAQSSQYIMRPVTVNFGCSSYDAAEGVVEALASGPYPCVIDSVSITDTNGYVSLGAIASSQGRARSVNYVGAVHVIFFERNDGSFKVETEDAAAQEAQAAQDAAAVQGL